MRAIHFTLVFMCLAGALVASRAGDNSTNQEQILPRVSFNNVPLSTAIGNLARQTGINYQIDPRCTAITGSMSGGIPEPVVTFEVTNVTARGLLVQMLTEHGLILTNDPVSNVATITQPGLPARSADYQLLNLDKIQPLEYATNGVLPLISFSDVPLDVGLQNIAQKAGPDVTIDPGFSSASYPVLTLRWQNLTAKQALLALCRNYGLRLVKGDAPGTVVIKPGAEAQGNGH